jgi:hypothetical protein
MQVQEKKFKNSPEVRAFLAGQQRDYRARKKLNKKASVTPRKGNHANLAIPPVKEAKPLE